jgi:hypothetical protein
MLSKILSTGLPFEKYVSKKISELGVYPSEQVPAVWIEGELPTAKVHESIVDIVATQHLHVIGPKKRMVLFINFLIECEYRKPNKKWIFFEHIYPKSYDVIVGKRTSWFLELVTDTKMKWANLVSSELSHAIEKHLSFPEASGFTEIFGEKRAKFQREDKPFLQAAKGALYHFRDSVELQKIDRSQEIWYEAYIPIVVTTAEINICKWDYKDINEFEQKAELSPQNAIIYRLSLPSHITDQEISMLPIVVLHSDSLKEFMRRVTNSIRLVLRKRGEQVSETFYVYVGKGIKIKKQSVNQKVET